DEPYRSRQNHQHGSNWGRDAVLKQRYAHAAVGGSVRRTRMRASVLHVKPLQFRRAGVHLDAGRQPPQQPQISDAALDLLRLKDADLHHARHPQVDSGEGKWITGWEHPDYGIGILIESNAAPDDLSVAGKPPLP